MDKTEKVKRKILRSARKAFLSQGLDGARMQDIANVAGVNKALLHYHFRNKESLYEQVLKSELKKLWQCLAALEPEDLSFPEKIREFCLRVRDLQEREKDSISFLFAEMHRHPDRLVPLLEDRPPLTHFMGQVKSGMEFGFIRKQPPEQLLIHLFSMVLFLPSAASFMIPVLVAEGVDSKAASQLWWEQLPEMLIRQMQ